MFRIKTTAPDFYVISYDKERPDFNVVSYDKERPITT